MQRAVLKVDEVSKKEFDAGPSICEIGRRAALPLQRMLDFARQISLPMRGAGNA